MTRRRRIKRWLRAWRRLILFGKMLVDLNDHGYTVVGYMPGSLMTMRIGDEVAANNGAPRVVTKRQALDNVRALFANEEIGEPVPMSPPEPPPPGPPDPPKPPDHRPVA